MVGENYPSNWDELRGRVLQQHLNQCVNCRRANSELHVHHIVPVENGGCHKQSNLVPLCPQCHKAAHGKTMAPRIRWYTNGELTDDEFGEHRKLWKQMRREIGVPRYDPDDESVYIPVADVERILSQIKT